MTIQETAQQAVALKHRGCNCCQAVVGALAAETDLSEKQLLQLAAGFGAGMGTMEATCGALVGAGMIAGLKTKGSMTGRVTRQITETFRSLCGAVTCRDLKGISTGRVLCPCDECVYHAVLAYGKSMGLS